jgi:hypothetical protein
MFIEEPYTVAKNLTEGVSNTLFTVPTGYEARVGMVFITNNGGNTKAISAAWHNNGNTIQFAASKNLLSKEALKFGGGYSDFMLMEEGDYMTMTPEAASTFTAIVSFMLVKSDGSKFDLTI